MLTTAKPCGKQLYDDYTELNPGAAKQFEAFLNQDSKDFGTLFVDDKE
jgi:hypothetical protein